MLYEHARPFVPFLLIMRVLFDVYSDVVCCMHMRFTCGSKHVTRAHIIVAFLLCFCLFVPVSHRSAVSAESLPPQPTLLKLLQQALCAPTRSVCIALQCSNSVSQRFCTCMFVYTSCMFAQFSSALCALHLAHGE